MTGYRERKKQRTFNEIVAVAAEMFREAGYEATTIETVAAEAGVSPGTVYNYFGTKNAILMAVVTADTEKALADSGSSADPSAGTAVDAVMPHIETYVNAMAAWGRDVLRALLVVSLDPAQSSMLDELVTLDERIIGQFGEVLADLQVRGLVKADVDVAAASLIVYSTVAVGIMMYIAYPEQTPEDMMALIRGQLSLAFDGIGA